MIDEWAKKWGVPAEAVRELFEDYVPEAGTATAMSEASVQMHLRLDAGYKGWRLWRNNVGAYMDGAGNFIRYGICNDTKRMNSTLKSSDLIGIRPRVIIAADVGSTIGQFVAIEVKHGRWQPSGTERERAQANFLALIERLGGVGVFSTGELPE